MRPPTDDLIVLMLRHTLIEDEDGAPLEGRFQPSGMLDEIERLTTALAEARTEIERLLRELPPPPHPDHTVNPYGYCVDCDNNPCVDGQRIEATDG